MVFICVIIVLIGMFFLIYKGDSGLIIGVMLFMLIIWILIKILFDSGGVFWLCMVIFNV